MIYAEIIHSKLLYVQNSCRYFVFRRLRNETYSHIVRSPQTPPKNQTITRTSVSTVPYFSDFFTFVNIKKSTTKAQEVQSELYTNDDMIHFFFQVSWTAQE